MAAALTFMAKELGPRIATQACSTRCLTRASTRVEVAEGGKIIKWQPFETHAAALKRRD
jgi:hypothetical protein